MASPVTKRESEYNLADFMDGEVEIDPDRVPLFSDERAARAAGMKPGDVFRTPGGHLGLVGVIPTDGCE